MSASGKWTVRMNPNPTGETLKMAGEKFGVTIRKDVDCACGHKESKHTLDPQAGGRACTENSTAPNVISNKVVACACQKFERSI